MNSHVLLKAVFSKKYFPAMRAAEGLLSGSSFWPEISLFCYIIVKHKCCSRAKQILSIYLDVGETNFNRQLKE
jgi:hypothetical protein